MLPTGRVLDLSLPLYSDSPGNPLLPPVELVVTAGHAADGYQMERLSLHTHCGTHIDATLHMWAEGRPLETIPTDRLVGPAAVFDMRHKQAREPIGEADLAESGVEPLPGSVALLVTGWTRYLADTPRWVHESPWLREDGATWLAQHKVTGVGIDHISVAGMEEEADYATHQTLARAGLWVAEGLIFPDAILEPASWLIAALPLPLRGAAGAPARVIAIELVGWPREGGCPDGSAD